MSNLRGQGRETRDMISELIADGDWSELAVELGFEELCDAPIPACTFDVWGLPRGDAEKFEELRVLVERSGFRLLVARGDVEYRSFRRMVLGLARRNVEDAALWWWDRGTTALAASATRSPDGRWRVRTIELSRRSPEAVALAAWRKLDRRRAVSADEVDHAVVMRRLLDEAFEHREITRSFFREFSSALDRLIETLQGGPDSSKHRHEICLAALLRIVFVYFLQRREMLDGDQAFVLRRLRQACAAGENFSRTVLKPLFFGALNRPDGERDARATNLGQLPFLNGGLFEPLPVEQEHPTFHWPNEVWRECIEGLLERYHFAVSETESDDARSAVDPEMLGRVFEGLMYGSSRRESGSFYTPRDTVREMVESAVAQHLVEDSQVSESVAQAIVSGRASELEGATAEGVKRALQDVTILDPAVGTGAFLLEALHCLRRCYRAIEGEARGPSMATYHRVRSMIHRHLFGVDIQHTAVRLCELRLWLALLETIPDVSNEEVPPLPNLAHRICAGNSLLSPMDLVRVRSGQAKAREQSWGLGNGRSISAAYRQQAKELQRRWLTSHGRAKREVREKLEECTRQMQDALLASRQQKLNEKLKPLERLADSRDLFGDDVELGRAQHSEAEDLREQLDALEQARADIQDGRAAGLAFSYAARFGPALERDGFDIIVTNPPWVRASRVDSGLKDLLKRRYRSHSNALWKGASNAGIRAPFGVQTDLAALFLERSLELLKPGGQLCALVPAKLLRSLHGAGVRRELMHHDILRLEDHSDAEQDMFDATVYPAVIQVQKRARETSNRRPRTLRRRPRACGPRAVEVTTWRGPVRSKWCAERDELPIVDGAPGAPWLLLEPDVSEVLSRLRAQSTTLGTVEALQPRRGLFTGCNARFLTDEAHARDVLGDAWQTWTRPVVRGRECRAWEFHTNQRIWWGYDDHGDVLESAPPAMAEFFEKHREQLEARSDYRSRLPLWQMYRVKPGHQRPKVLWRDLGPRLEATFAGPDVVPLNTVYFVPFDSQSRARVFEALLNCEAVRSVAYALGERARGGWRRHFSWVMRMLPVPDPLVRVFRGDAEVRDVVSKSELGVLRHGTPGEKEKVAGTLGARWFGLNTVQVRCLAEWRRAGREDVLEVAA